MKNQFKLWGTGVLALGLFSCAAEKKTSSELNPVVGQALWTAAQMPAIQGDQWSAFHKTDPQVNRLLLQVQNRSVEFVPGGSIFDETDGFEEYFDTFLPSLTEGAESESGGASAGLPSSPLGGSSLPVSPFEGGTLPSAPGVGAGSLPTAPGVGALTLSPTPSFLRDLGGGAVGSTANFASSFCRFIASSFSLLARCTEIEGADEVYSSVNLACQGVFTSEAEQYLAGVAIPSSVIAGIDCLSNAIEAETACDGSHLDNAFASCGLLYEVE